MNLISPVALFLIDVQQGLDDPGWGSRNNPATRGKIVALELVADPERLRGLDLAILEG